MIAKISATENLGGALGYNFKKVNKKEATLLMAHGLYQNRAGEYTMSEVVGVAPTFISSHSSMAEYTNTSFGIQVFSL